MFLNLEGKQFSKSRGVVIDSREIVEQFGNDVVRFYLCHIMPEKNDSSFTWEDFQQKVNSILIGTYGNYIHRVLSIASKVTTPLTNEEELQPETIDAIQTSAQKVYVNLENASFKEYLEALMGLASYGNKRFDSQKVWELKDQPDRIAHELTQHYAIIVSLGILAEPLLLEGVEALWKQLGLNKPSQWPHIDSFAVDVRERVQQGTWPHTPIPLYKRVEDEDLPMRKSLPKS